MKNNLELTTKINEEMIIQIHNLFLKEWWTNSRSLDDTKLILNSSDILFSLIEIHSNKVIGFARVLTDWIDTALIMDVIVDADYRNTGLGKYIVNSITNYKELQNLKKFDLHCKNDLEEFYNKSDFRQTPEMIWLRKTK